jgi:hypothetical protein
LVSPETIGALRNDREASQPDVNRDRENQRDEGSGVRT